MKSGDKLSEETNLIRITQKDSRHKSLSHGDIPAANNFDLSPNDQGKLSVNWLELTSAEETLIILGSSVNLYKTRKVGTLIFKDFENRFLYSFPTKEVSELEFVISVCYDPVKDRFIKEGLHDNNSHSIIEMNYSDLFRPMIAEKLRDIAINNNQGKPMDVDMDIVQEKVFENRTTNSKLFDLDFCLSSS